MSGLRRLVAALALVLILPGEGEAIENLAHFASFGHFAHASGTPDSHQAPANEHGCSGTFHVCSCCPSTSAVLHSDVAPEAQQSPRPGPALAEPLPSACALPAPERPPRS